MSQTIKFQICTVFPDVYCLIEATVTFQILAPLWSLLPNPEKADLVTRLCLRKKSSYR